MSLLSQASLCVTPSAYKEGKLYSVIPSDGSGDMSVVRATTATRVNSAGLVELVPYNQFTWSQNFDNADWNNTNCSITANNTTAPDGTTTADKLILDNGQSGSSSDGTGIRQLVDIASGSYTYSIYAKAAEFTTIRFRENQLTGAFLTIDLTNGAITNGDVGQYINPTATLVSNGWYRITFQTPTLTALYKYSVRVSETGNGTSGIFIWGYQAVEGSVAKDYQKTETRLNIPRLDYSNGTCPSLLVEPQRTNRLIYSEQLIQGRAWAFTSGTFTVTENTTETLDPFGNNNADKFNATTQSNNDSYTSTSGSGNLTISIFAKKGTNDSIQLYHDNVLSGGAFSATFNLTSGTITASSGTASIQDLGNGWYRCSVSGTDSNSSGNIHGVTTYTGTTYLFGVQLEQGSYATSYIPTTSASVTRNADVISKTGISSLIGQTEGTLFMDVVIPTMVNTGANFVSASLFNNSLSVLTAFDIYDNGDLFAVHVNGTTQALIQKTGLTSGHHKIAFAYKANDFVLYIDGVLVGVDNSGTVGSQDSFGFQYGINQFTGQQYVKAAALWKTRLTNTQLATLTTI